VAYLCDVFATSGIPQFPGSSLHFWWHCISVRAITKTHYQSQHKDTSEAIPNAAELKYLAATVTNQNTFNVKIIKVK
jgi:hypothetical protein